MKNYNGPNLKFIEEQHPEFLDFARKFNDDGYVVINLHLKTNLLTSIINDLKNILSEQKFKKNPNFYHYNESPRIVEAWKLSTGIKNLALNEKILKLLEILYCAKPLPFSTINFIKGTEQPLHSDYIHFGSMPELYLVGAWTALEDISQDSGPLSVVRKSHKTPIVTFRDLGFDNIPKTTKEIKERYAKYESFLDNYILENNLEVITPILKAGETLIWSANLFHGAGKIQNKKKLDIHK